MMLLEFHETTVVSSNALRVWKHINIVVNVTLCKKYRPTVYIHIQTYMFAVRF
jgi:hypothetical protein